MECFLLLKKSLDPRLREDDEKSCIAISVGQDGLEKFLRNIYFLPLKR